MWIGENIQSLLTSRKRERERERKRERERERKREREIERFGGLQIERKVELINNEGIDL